VQPKPSAATIEVLSALWQRVLRRPRIEQEENFFDAGGDPWLAIELFREIGKTTGRDLLPMLIYQAPTLRALSALLENETAPRLAPVVLMRAGTQEPPVFLLHGMGGNLMELSELVRRMKTERAIYGMQSRGTDGMEEPCCTVKQFAEFHLETMRRVQPNGPYLLIGYSFGGLVAFEMAQRMADRDREVGLLVLIDSYPHRRYVPLDQRAGIGIRKTRARGKRAVGAVLGRRPQAGAPGLGTAFTPAMRRVQECAQRALDAYRPAFYEGDVRFVRAGDSLHFPHDPSRVWTKLAEGFTVETVPGDHNEVLSTYADRLAATVSGYLADVSPPDKVKALAQ